MLTLASITVAVAATLVALGALLAYRSLDDELVEARAERDALKDSLNHIDDDLHLFDRGDDGTFQPVEAAEVYQWFAPTEGGDDDAR